MLKIRVEEPPGQTIDTPTEYLIHLIKFYNSLEYSIADKGMIHLIKSLKKEMYFIKGTFKIKFKHSLIHYLKDYHI